MSAGTGGQTLQVDWAATALPAWLAHRDESQHGYARLCFDGARSLRGQFVGADDVHAPPSDEFVVCRTPPCAGAPGTYWYAVPQGAAAWRVVTTAPGGLAWTGAAFVDSAWTVARAPFANAAADAGMVRHTSFCCWSLLV